MFTTLLSQETRTLAPKLALIAGIGVLIIAVSLGLAALKIPLVSGFLLMASCLMIAMVPLLVLLQVATSYWKSMHCDAGYFTHTLPVTGGQLFWAKSIFAYIVGLVGVFWAIAASCAVFVQIAWMNGVSFNEFLSSTLDSWNALPLAIKTLLTVAVLVQLANLVFPVAAVMSIGAQSRWNHLGFGAPVIGFILLYLANQFTAVFGMLLLPGGIDTTALLKEANEHGVAYVAGEGFFAGNTGRGKNCMRISFGNVTPEKIDIGMKRLGELIASKLR